MKKKIFALVLMAFLLCGCGQNSVVTNYGGTKEINVCMITIQKSFLMSIVQNANIQIQMKLLNPVMNVQNMDHAQTRTSQSTMKKEKNHERNH